MKTNKIILILIAFFVSIGAFCEEQIHLKKPDKDSYIKLLNKRKSIRNFSNKKLSIKKLSYLLYSANARTPKGNRTAPSAGALYPIDIYVYADKIKGLSKGIYYYNPRYHYLTPFKKGNYSNILKTACYYQNSVKHAAAVIIFVFEIRRMKYKYKERSINYAYIEAGHISQNILLAITRLNLAGVPIGAFDEENINKILGFNIKKKIPLYVNLVGNKS